MKHFLIAWIDAAGLGRYAIIGPETVENVFSFIGAGSRLVSVSAL